jgi:predicted lipoprotein
MRRIVGILVALVALALLFWLFPPFRIVPLKQAQAAKEQAAFDAAEYAATFWTNRLLASLDRATDAATLIAVLKQDSATAAQRYGRRVGLGSSTFYFVQGTGMVVSAERRGVGISLRTNAPAEVLFHTGLLFGNALRDATGLLDVSAFPNSQDFNDLSTELNRIVETGILPSLKTNAATGRRLRFVGCAEVEADAVNVIPLKVVPIKVEFE